MGTGAGGLCVGGPGHFREAGGGGFEASAPGCLVLAAGKPDPISVEPVNLPGGVPVQCEVLGRSGGARVRVEGAGGAAGGGGAPAGRGGITGATPAPRHRRSVPGRPPAHGALRGRVGGVFVTTAPIDNEHVPFLHQLGHGGGKPHPDGQRSGLRGSCRNVRTTTSGGGRETAAGRSAEPLHGPSGT